jgi:hypothetical protein
MIGRVCLAHRQHSDPVPIVFHHVRPVSRGGEGTLTVQLCANAHGLVHSLLDDIEAVAVTAPYATVDEVIRLVPRPIWASYPGPVRVIAYKGWREYGLGFLGGRYVQQYRLWDTRGAARNANTPAYSDVRHAARWSRKWRNTAERL